MHTLLLVTALPVAVVAAVRGIWSPCGLSMLSSITPMTEAGRGNRFGRTAAWFLAGSVLGGLSIGLLAGLVALLIGLLPLTAVAVAGIGAVAAVLTAGIDFGVGGAKLPIFKRQVNDAWLRNYRSWVYGAGFGWQIGFGVATYIMSGAVFLTIALAALTTSLPAALLIGATFGLVRGSAVYLGRSATSPARLGEVHERLDRLGPAARQAARWVQVLAAVVLAAAVHPVAAVAVVALAAGLVLVDRRSRPAPAASH